MMNKTLVACFSATGTTAAIAKEIADIAHADVLEIVPVKPYSERDLDWNDKQSRSSLEMNDPASRPAIAGKISDMGEYRTVFLGFPVWWHAAPLSNFKKVLVTNDCGSNQKISTHDSTHTKLKSGFWAIFSNTNWGNENSAGFQAARVTTGFSARPATGLPPGPGIIVYG